MATILGPDIYCKTVVIVGSFSKYYQFKDTFVVVCHNIFGEVVLSPPRLLRPGQLPPPLSYATALTALPLFCQTRAQQ